MTKPTSMTELEAVNVLLTTIGEQPINSLSGNQTTDVSIARQVLTEVSREVQSQGWHFNTEPDVTLVPDSTNKNITVPIDVARIDSKYANVVIRGDKLFNVEERTFVFQDNLKCDIIYFHDFLDLPHVAKKYITSRAARIFSDRSLNSESLHRMLRGDEMQALVNLKEYENDTASHSMFDSYSVARVLQRGHKRRVLS